jgi:uncharacterized membrane protein
MADADPRLSKSILAYSAAHGVVNVAWLVESRGWRGAVPLVVIGTGLPALAEVWITSLDRILNHRMRPRLLGVPLAVPLLWFNVIFGTVAAVEPLVRRQGEARSGRLLAPVTSATATSLDLVMDCFGLDEGLWEWNLDGPYAAQLEGTNGRTGIPLLNFFGWLFLVATIVFMYRSLGRNGESDTNGEITRSVSAAMLMPYYATSAVWAVRRRQLRYLIYSSLFPVMMIAALRPRRR